MSYYLNPKSISKWARLLSLYKPTHPNCIRILSQSPLRPLKPPLFSRHFSASSYSSSSTSTSTSTSTINGDRILRELVAEAEKERQMKKEAKEKEGVEGYVDSEDEDFLNVGPRIEKLEKKWPRLMKDLEWMESRNFWEPTDSESEDEEHWLPEEVKKREQEFNKKCDRHGELLRNFAEAETIEDAHKWRTRIDKFEDRHLKLPVEYRVIGDMMNRLKKSTGKERFMLLQKINRAVGLMEIKEAFDPNNPANFGVIQHSQVASPDDVVDTAGFDKQKAMIGGAGVDDDDEDFDETKEQDEIFMAKINAIEKKIEEKLELLEHTFGKKRRVLEEDITDLVEERNSLTEKKRRPLYRKGFDIRVLDVNRTVKVTKGGQLVKYTALLATGNYHGVVGFAKAKAPNAQTAIQRAYEKCFQNLHYVDRYEGHTIAHAIQAKYEKTKIYLWPASIRSGMKAGRQVEAILRLAGFTNIKAKIIGSRNPLNVAKALFIALNAVETPKDVQEKFGRTVVESYLL